MNSLITGSKRIKWQHLFLGCFGFVVVKMQRPSLFRSMTDAQKPVVLIGQPPAEAPPPARLSLPYKVMKSLDGEVYRNLEFDVWQDTCKGKTHLCLVS